MLRSSGSDFGHPLWSRFACSRPPCFAKGTGLGQSVLMLTTSILTVASR